MRNDGFVLRIEPSANRDFRRAYDTYLWYFLNIGHSDKGFRWAEDFKANYLKRLEELKENPYRFPVISVFPFDTIRSEYRHCTIGWFTLFYTVEGTTVNVWYLKNSRSDFSSLNN